MNSLLIIYYLFVIIMCNNVIKNLWIHIILISNEKNLFELISCWNYRTQSFQKMVLHFFKFLIYPNFENKKFIVKWYASSSVPT